MQRSCHTALENIVRTWAGTKWFIEFDIEGYFDNIDHKILVGLLEKKIDDTKFLNVIRKMLKAGYVEEWKFFPTYSGTPQGGIISPILANIYLHELDCFMERLIADFNRGKTRRLNPEYSSISQKGRRLNKKIEQETNPEDRECLIEQKEVMQRRMLEIPSVDQHDPDYRRLRYCRYADDFVLGAICDKKEAEEIYRKIEIFLHVELRLQTSQAKSGLKHNTEVIRFLGYDITIRNTERIVSVRTKDQQHYKKRSFKGKITLTVPKAKMQGFAEKRSTGTGK